MKISQAAAAGFEWETLMEFGQNFMRNWQNSTGDRPGNTRTTTSRTGRFAVYLINLARWYNLSNKCFTGNQPAIYPALIANGGVCRSPLSDYTLAELETLWQQAKAQLGQ